MHGFRHRRVLLVVFALLNFMASGCGNAGPAAAPATGHQPSAFQLTLLQDSFTPGGGLDAAAIAVTALDDTVTVTVSVTGAAMLKAFYCDLTYDSRCYSLRSAAPSAGFQQAGEVLNLYHATGDGVVHYGQVLARLGSATGFSGNGSAVEFSFAPRGETSAAARPVSMVPTAATSAVPLNWDAATGTLTWDYYHQGDYNQDGLVTVSDLTPLGIHYDTAGPFEKNSALSCVDGNSDGYITVADITPIGANYNSQVAEYYVFASDDPDDDYPDNPADPSTISARASVTMAEDVQGDKASERLSFTFTVTEPQAGDSYWVRPADGSNEGVPSNIVNDLQWRRWDIQTVDHNGDVGHYVSLDLNTGDEPHICYFDRDNGDLKYAWFNGLNWQNEIVDSENNTGWFCSLDLDSTDTPHIAYRDDTTRDLKYATKAGADWVIETVDSEGNVGQFTDIAVDSNDLPCIVYIDEYPNGNLYFARHNGTAWDIQTVDDSGDNGGYTCLALDSNDLPHISYHRPNRLMYAAWDGTAWQTMAIRWFEVGIFSAIALDSNDYPHLTCFHKWYHEGEYSMWDGSDWQHSTFDGGGGGDIGWCTSLALGADDQPQVSYTDGGKGDLRFARMVEGSWVVEIIDSAGDTGYYTSLKLDSQGVPHIAYSDFENGNLRYATP